MTAVLENVNPYSKYGLTRKPTYEEIIGLIGENETITGKLPNRDETFFKASPEGSFFDGLDHLEILKEPQNRIHERQMRELMMRSNIGGTFSVARLQERMRKHPSRDTSATRYRNERSINTSILTRTGKTSSR